MKVFLMLSVICIVVGLLIGNGIWAREQQLILAVQVTREKEAVEAEIKYAQEKLKKIRQFHSNALADRARKLVSIRHSANSLDIATKQYNDSFKRFEAVETELGELEITISRACHFGLDPYAMWLEKRNKQALQSDPAPHD